LKGSTIHLWFFFPDLSNSSYLWMKYHLIFPRCVFEVTWNINNSIVFQFLYMFLYHYVFFFAVLCVSKIVSQRYKNTNLLLCCRENTRIDAFWLQVLYFRFFFCVLLDFHMFVHRIQKLYGLHVAKV